MRRSSYEEQWKQFVTVFFPELVLLVHPELHGMVDWQRGFEFLEQELLRIAPESGTGRRMVDKLARVHLKNGAEQWILVHIEIQSTAQTEFAERVYVYNTLAWLKYRRDVVSIAILADKNRNWRPSRYERSFAGCRTEFEFIVCKVLDYEKAQLQAAAPQNPAALVMLAFRQAMDTEGAPDLRYQARVELTRLALEMGYTEAQIQEIIRLLEWAMKLPKELEREYRRLIARIKREERTPYLASFEREAIRKGLRQGYAEGKQEGYAEGKQEGYAEGKQEGRQEGLREGLQQGLLQILEKRFGDVSPSVRQKVERVQSPEQLLQLYTEALNAATLADFGRVAEQYLNETEEPPSNSSESPSPLTE